MSNFKKLSALLLFLLCQHIVVNAQALIPPTIEIPDGATIEWQEDGSVIVTGGPVTFTSGIAPAVANTPNAAQIKDDEMILVNETAYIDALTYGQLDYGLVLESIDGTTPEATIKVFRRAAIDGDNLNTLANKYGFKDDLSDPRRPDSYLVYGLEYKDANTTEAWQAYGYRSKHYEFKDDTFVDSNDYMQLWNRPHDTKFFHKWNVKKVLIVVAIAAVIVAAAVLIIASGGSDAAVVGSMTQSIVSSLAAAFSTAAGSIGLTTMAAARLGIALVVGFGSFIYYMLDSHHIQDLTKEEIAYSPIVDSYFPQMSFTTNKEIELRVPNANMDLADVYNKQIIDFYNAQLPFAHDCSFDASKKCFYAPYEPVQTKITVTNAHLKQIKIPGSLEPNLTPYRAFKHYHYKVDETGQTWFEPGTSMDDYESTTGNAVFGDTNIMELPRDIIKANSDGQTAELRFAHFTGNEYFYLIDKEVPVNLPNAYYKDLGKYGEYDADGDGTAEDYHLYRYMANSDNVNDLVELTLDADGPFVGAHNVVPKNYIEKEDIVINNGYVQAMFENDAFTPHLVTEDVELTVNGNVLIADFNDLGDSATLLGTDNYQLHVGSKTITDDGGISTLSEGIVAENFIMRDRADFILPDFVFESEFKKPTLSELDAFIKENKHLPNVPSQKQVDDTKHYSVADMLIGQLQNLEELYLHTFEQQAKLDSLKQDKQAMHKQLTKLRQRIEQLKKEN